MMFSKDELERSMPVYAFNKQRRKYIIPSWLLVGDESMSAWKGAEGVIDGAEVNCKSFSFLHFVERKPEPLGLEIKVLMNAQVCHFLFYPHVYVATMHQSIATAVVSGVFLGLEIQKDADIHIHQPFYDDYGHSAAVSLRLLTPFLL